MPYDPYAPSEADRARVYWLTWIGAGATLLLAANLVLGMDNILSALATGAAAGGMLASVFTARTDSYFQSLCSVGHRWAMFAIAAYLIVLFLLDIADLAHGAGYRLASGTPRESTGPAMAAAVDAWTVLIGVSLAYYAGYAFAVLRDRFGSAG